MIIAHTLKGRGLSPFAEDDVNRRHGETLDEEELETALAELDEERAEMMASMIEEPELTVEDVHGKLKL